MSKNNPKRPLVEGGVAQLSDAEGPRGQQRPLPKRSRPQEQPSRLPRNPVLQFSPIAWAKLQWFCQHGETEIGGFAVSDPADPLYIIEFVTVKQDADWVSVKFDDTAVADFFDGQVDLGRRPEQFARAWCHTHPGDSPTPSGTDEETFARVFGSSDWAIMFVLARTGKTYARLRFNVGPGGHGEIPVEVDWSRPFTGTDHAAWLAEYEANIKPNLTGLTRLDVAGDDWGFGSVSSHRSTTPGGKADVQQPDEPFGADAAMMADALEFDESWADLLYQAEWSDLDAAAERVCIRWGMTDCSDWTEAVLSLSPDRQREFRQEVEAILSGQLQLEVVANGF
jgi:hypothetical protein